MFKEKPEYGMVLIKPDGVESQLLPEVMFRLQEAGLILVAHKQVHLQKQEVMQHFLTDFQPDLYADYLSRCPLDVLLVRGEMAAYQTRQIKLAIRQKYGVSAAVMRNLIHTVDYGNEFATQFKLFFPELEEARYSGIADLNVVLSDWRSESVCQELLRVERETNLSWLGLVVDASYEGSGVDQFVHSSERGQLKVMLTVRQTFEVAGQPIALLGHLPSNWTGLPRLPADVLRQPEQFLRWVTERDGISVLDYLPVEAVTVELLWRLQELGLHGVLTYDPRRSLRDAIFLEEIVEENTSLRYSGGTGGRSAPGQLSIGKRDFHKLFPDLKARGAELC